MGDWGIKVSGSGYEATSTAVSSLLLSSKYPMLKFHSETTTSVTLNPGDTEQTTTVNHSLGYVPAFIAFFEFDSKSYIIPSIPYGVDFEQYAFASASNTQITVGFATSIPYNQLSYNVTDYYSTAFGPINQAFQAGHVSAHGGAANGAMRFDNIALAGGDTITSATITAYVSDKGSGTGDAKIITYGIDEDDTAALSSNAWERAQTSASVSQNVSRGTTPFTFGINVTSMVDEIKGRVGWASGNAMGFTMWDNASPTDCFLYDSSSSLASTLSIVKSGTLTVPFRVVIFKDKIAD